MINWKDSKYKSISDIKAEKQADGSNFFSQNELIYFDDPLVEGKLENAQKVAELVEDVKKAEATKKKDEPLLNKLALLQTNRNLEYKVVNREEGRVEAAIYLLSLWSGAADKSAADRKLRVQELEKKVTDNNIKRATNDKLIRGFASSLKEAIEERSREEKIYRGRASLRSILTNTGQVFIDNKWVDISTVSSKYEIPDFSGANSIIDDASTITSKIASATSGTGATINEIVEHANNFLSNISSINTTPASISSFKETELSLYNDAKWNSKHNISTDPDEFGLNYMSVLRDIGADKLEEIIKVSPYVKSSKKAKLVKIAKEITKYIAREEVITGENGLDNVRKFLFTEKGALEYDKKSSIHAKNFLKIKPSENSEFKCIPNWESVFEFMKEVFPIKSSSNYELKNSNYLDKQDDPNYLKPSDTSKRGWEGLTLGGFAYNPRDPSTKSDPIKLAKIKSQMVPKNIESDTDFKTLTKMWWETFGPFMEDRIDSDKNEWMAGFKVSTPNLTGDESYRERALECLRYCRTMQQLLLKLGINKEVNDADDILIEIVGEAQKGRLVFPDRTKVIENLKRITDSDYPEKDSIAKAVQEGKIWSQVGKWEDYAVVKLANISGSSLEVHNEQIKHLNGKISELQTDNISLEIEIRDWEKEKKLYQNWEEFNEKDLPSKKVDFEALYAKGKWNWDELEQMINFLGLIKTETGDDAVFDAEFKDKQDALLDKKSKVVGPRANIELNWKKIKEKKNGSLVEAIKAIIKNESKKGTTLNDIENYFAEYTNHLELEEGEQNDLDEIKKAIAEPSKYEDKKTPTFNKNDLAALFTFDVDDALFSKWNTSVDGATIDKTKIENVVVNSYAPGKAENPKLIAHLVDKGDDDGVKDYETGDDDKNKNSWKKLIEKGPKTVIRTIMAHENDGKLDTIDENNEIVKAMKADAAAGYDADPTKNKFKKERYGNPEDFEGSEKPTKEKLINYLFDKALNNVSQGSVWKTSEDNGDGNKEEGGVLKHLTDNWYWYAGALVLLIILAGVVFWKSIADWWNGPAEEQGKGEVEKDDEEEEEGN